MKKTTRFLTHDTQYGYEHPKVLVTTEEFFERAAARHIFANIDAALANCGSRRLAALVIANLWLAFTRKVPGFISAAVTMATRPELQHQMVQIAFDELGREKAELVHSLLFIEAVKEAEIELDPDACVESIRPVLDLLDEALRNAKSDAGILGLLLSLEIIAERNIETLFECLSFDEAAGEALAATSFMTIHRADEVEHIRHSVANYLMHCRSNGERDDALVSFDTGLGFWVQFWDHCARQIQVALGDDEGEE